jgi:hypothetical protein
VRAAAVADKGWAEPTGIRLGAPSGKGPECENCRESTAQGGRVSSLDLVSRSAPPSVPLD